jgi:small-conductance mechanosensitive channel
VAEINEVELGYLKATEDSKDSPPWKAQRESITSQCDFVRKGLKALLKDDKKYTDRYLREILEEAKDAIEDVKGQCKELAGIKTLSEELTNTSEKVQQLVAEANEVKSVLTEVDELCANMGCTRQEAVPTIKAATGLLSKGIASDAVARISQIIATAELRNLDPEEFVSLVINQDLRRSGLKEMAEEHVDLMDKIDESQKSLLHLRKELESVNSKFPLTQDKIKQGESRLRNISEKELEWKSLIIAFAAGIDAMALHSGENIRKSFSEYLDRSSLQEMQRLQGLAAGLDMVLRETPRNLKDQYFAGWLQMKMLPPPPITAPAPEVTDEAGATPRTDSLYNDVVQSKKQSTDAT